MRTRHLTAAAALVLAVGCGAHPPSPQARVTTATAPNTGAVPAIITAQPPPTTTSSVLPPSTTTTARRPPPPPPLPVGDVEAAIAQAFGPELYPAALRVARCESSLDPTARTGDHVGLFQLSTRYHAHRAAKFGYTWAQVATEAYPNAVVAADLQREQGWRPWTCKP